MAVVGLDRARRLSLLRVDRRMVLGVVLAAAAALTVLVLTRPTPTLPVLVAAADLAPGVPLGADDVRVREVASDRGLVGGDGIGELAGWVLAAPLAAGEPLLPSLLRPPERVDRPDAMALSVPASQAVLGGLAAGDLVDIYATAGGVGTDTPATELLAGGVYVIDATTDAQSLGGTPAVELLLAVDRDHAGRLAAASHHTELDLVRVGP